MSPAHMVFIVILLGVPTLAAVKFYGVLACLAASRATDAAGARTLQQRLAELDSLRDTGAITDDEHQEARARVLANA